MTRTTGSHSIHVTLDMPDYESVRNLDKRQWILNLGQEGQKAEHWLWSPSGKVGGTAYVDIQFGGWSWGNQITAFNWEPATTHWRISAAKSLTTTYNTATGNYNLYMNQKHVAWTDTPNFEINSNTLTVAMLPKSYLAGDEPWHRHQVPFSGCVHSVELWHAELSAENVWAL